MARAITQNRSADHAANSDAVFRYYWKDAWVDRSANGGVRTSETDAYTYSLAKWAPAGEEMILLLDRNRPIVLANNPDIPAAASQPSYPVLVDPIGYQTQGSFGLANAYNVDGALNLPTRTSLAAAEWDKNVNGQTYRTRVRLTTLLDDMSWDVDGEPSAATGQLDRGDRFTCSWLIQRPKNNVPHEVHLFVLVFAGRSPTDTPSAEQHFNNAYATGYYGNVEPKPNTITVPLGVNPTMPNVRRGGWVAFSVPITPAGGVRYPAFDFYRVAGVTDDIANSGTIALEFEQPLRSYDTNTMLGDGATTSAYAAANGQVYGTVVFFDNLTEVFDRGIVSAQGISGR